MALLLYLYAHLGYPEGLCLHQHSEVSSLYKGSRLLFPNLKHIHCPEDQTRTCYLHEGVRSQTNCGKLKLLLIEIVFDIFDVIVDPAGFCVPERDSDFVVLSEVHVRRKRIDDFEACGICELTHWID